MKVPQLEQRLSQYESLALSSATKIKNLWKLSILIKVTLNQLFPSSLKNCWKALVPICPPVLSNTKILWKLSIQMKITSNQLFPSSLRIHCKLKSQLSLKSVRWDWQNEKPLKIVFFIDMVDQYSLEMENWQKLLLYLL